MIRWQHTGRERPDFAVEPGPGQESVWDYPRPPETERMNRSVEIYAGSRLLARAATAIRLKETASPPTWYLHASAVNFDLLVEGTATSYCEWKGAARYWALADDPTVAVAWAYPDVAERYHELADHLSFYPGRVDCRVDGHRVQAQPGGFYGGWITADIVGPFKGDPGTGDW